MSSTRSAPPGQSRHRRPLPRGCGCRAVAFRRRSSTLSGCARLNGLPLSLDLTYLAPDVGGPLLGEDLAHNDIFALIEARAVHRLGGASITVEAVSADPHTAAVLETPAGAALLMVERLTRLADDRPVDLEYIRLRGDQLVLRGELTRTDRGPSSVSS